FERIAGILGEIPRPTGCSGPVDWRQQHQVASGVVDLAAAQGKAVAVVLEPPAVVNHEAKEALLESDDVASSVFLIPGGVHAASGFAAGVPGYGESHLVQKAIGMIVVFDLDAVVGVIASAVGNAQSISTYAVIVGQQRQPWCRAPQDLPTQAQAAIRPRVS